MKPKKPAVNAAVKWEQLAAAVLEMRKALEIHETRLRMLEDEVQAVTTPKLVIQ